MRVRLQDNVIVFAAIKQESVASLAGRKAIHRADSFTVTIRALIGVALGEFGELASTHGALPAAVRHHGK